MRKSVYKDALNTVIRAHKWSKKHYGYPSQAAIREARLALKGRAPKSENKAAKAAALADRIEMYRADNGGSLPSQRESDIQTGMLLRDRAGAV